MIAEFPLGLLGFLFLYAALGIWPLGPYSCYPSNAPRIRNILRGTCILFAVTGVYLFVIQ